MVPNSSRSCPRKRGAGQAPGRSGSAREMASVTRKMGRVIMK